MKPLITILVILLFAATLVSAQEARITVRVLDQLNDPVTNAHVTAGFATAIKPGWGWGAGRPNDVIGNTDTNGLCVLSGEGNGGSVGVSASKEAYYGSSGYQVVFTNLVGAVDKQWQPWNPTIEVTLKSIGDPIAMYAKRVWQEPMPVAGHPVGFDMKEGDWVVPHGKGKTADLIFTYVSEPEGSINTRYGEVKTYNYSLSVTFSKEGDGLVPVQAPTRGRSVLRLPRNAPETGYQASIVKRVYRGQDMQSHSDIQDDANYFVRVRTVKDEDGKIISALYGKIHGDFQFDHKGELTFTYYLNPTPNDRNLEFDPKKNLFKNLSSQEEVREP